MIKYFDSNFLTYFDFSICHSDIVKMVRLIEYKILLFAISVTSLTICALVISIGSLEIYVDVTNYGSKTGKSHLSVHKLVAFAIQCSANILIFINQAYMAIHALRGERYTWYVSCNYFLYILCEFVSAVIIVTEYHDYHYPIWMASLVSVQFVSLFSITCIAELIFTRLEEIYCEETDKILYRRVVTTVKKRIKKRIPCVRINLHEPTPGPSGVGKR